MNILVNIGGRETSVMGADEANELLVLMLKRRMNLRKHWQSKQYYAEDLARNAFCFANLNKRVCESSDCAALGTQHTEVSREKDLKTLVAYFVEEQGAAFKRVGVRVTVRHCGGLSDERLKEKKGAVSTGYLLAIKKIGAALQRSGVVLERDADEELEDADDLNVNADNDVELGSSETRLAGLDDSECLDLAGEEEMAGDESLGGIEYDSDANGYDRADLE